MTLLQDMQRERLQHKEQLRAEVRERLRAILRRTMPGQRVVVFGSLVQVGQFHEESDIDLAIESEPADISLYQLIALLAEDLGRPVDILLLSETRLREKILREGETWTVQD